MPNIVSFRVIFSGTTILELSKTEMPGWPEVCLIIALLKLNKLNQGCNYLYGDVRMKLELALKRKDCGFNNPTPRMKQWPLLLISLGMLCMTTPLYAKGPAIFDPAPLSPPPAAPRAFDMIGFLEEAKLDEGNIAGTCGHKATDDRLAGGTAKINGITITIPCNTVVQMPATSITWADLFYLNPAGSGASLQTGLALADTQISPTSGAPFNAVLPSYEVRIQGNIVGGHYIAGLVFVSQEHLNIGQGVIEKINYQLGQLDIKTNKSSEIVRVRINDPVGRFGKPHALPGSTLPDAVIESAFDPRFTADVDNPTIRSVTGYPMCIPRTNPFLATQGDDLLCPESNRPRSPNCPSLPELLAGRVGFPPFTLPATGQYCNQYVMDPPSGAIEPCSGSTCPTDPTRQAPFEVGDFVNYSGTWKTEVNPTTGAVYSYISAHTLIANLGIYTAPGIPPAYVAIEHSQVGTNALAIANLPQETTSGIKVVGFSTDPTTLVDIFMVDVDYATGLVSDRLIGTENPGLPPVIGRFRFQPVAGSYGPFTRDIRIVSRTACRIPRANCASSLPLSANGIQAGQYRAPNFEFIFPEVVRTGDRIVPNNFQDLYFLYCGSGPIEPAPFDTVSATSPVAGPLDPSPWAAPMPSPLFAASCPPPNGVALPLPVPVVNAGLDQATIPGTTITLTGSATDPLGTALTGFNWQQVSGTPVVLTPSGTAAAPKLTFKAPAAGGVLTFALNVTNANGLTGTNRVSVAVNVDAINIVSAVYDNKQGKGALKIIATSSLPAATTGLKLTVQATNGTFKLAATAQAMTKVANTATVNNCPVDSNPCWQYSVVGVIKNTISTGFIPPTRIVVNSSRGGSAVLTGSAIVVK
jgi:hypothetical protein